MIVTDSPPTSRPDASFDALVLSGGASRRMGRPKAQLEIGGHSLLAHHAAWLRGATRRVVVSGAHHEIIQAQVAREALPLEVVFNDRHVEGQLSSLRAGLRALTPLTRPVVVVLVDQAPVTGFTPQALLAPLVEVEADHALPTFEARPGHPVVLSPRAAARALEDGAAASLRELLAMEPALRVPVSSAEILDDIDHPADLARARKVYMDSRPEGAETMDRAYETADYRPSELQHRYRPNYHILDKPLARNLLARLGDPETIQPTINGLVKMLYQTLVDAVVSAEFPRQRMVTRTRMAELTERGEFENEMIDPDTGAVSVAIARAGILPSHICYERLNHVLNPAVVRQDHLVMSRITNQSDEVTGAGIGGHKIGGPVGDRILLVPDPMGATGSSICTAIDLYKSGAYGVPAKIITLNLIITPEYLKTVQDRHPEVIVYAWRLDRGLSSAEVRATVPGERWDEERGLNEQHYVVPGAGGLGEILNNAYV
jgi:uracil phosphoribosyltransferase